VGPKHREFSVFCRAAALLTVPQPLATRVDELPVEHMGERQVLSLVPVGAVVGHGR
jgi:hypothetical protein